MIAADTSAWVDYSKGAESRLCAAIEQALSDGLLAVPLPVLYEILSAPGLTREAEKHILNLPTLLLPHESWVRTGQMRRVLLKKGLKARSMDCLIAQTCIENKVPLIASDRDYRHFTKFGLQLI